MFTMQCFSFPVHGHIALAFNAGRFLSLFFLIVRISSYALFFLHASLLTF
jgi:hypothetical protein